MKEKKKINISVLLMLLAIIIVIGISYAAFVFITNSGIIEANSGKLDIAYNIENSSVNGTLIPSSTRNGGISTSVTAKLNSGSIPGNINLYITPTALTGMPFSALMWEVDVVDTSDNLLTHYEGDFTGSIINTPVKITDAYGLTSNLLTFKIYIWLNGERINNENYNSNNGFTATISADSIAITGEFDPTYTVIFDADGGIGASGTKSVRVGEDYGLLPTPTKEGYTFKGWNGKNKFNFDVDNMLYITYYNSNDDTRSRYGFCVNNLNEKTYTLAYDLEDENSVPSYLYYMILDNNNVANDLIKLTTTTIVKKKYSFNAIENNRYCIYFASAATTLPVAITYSNQLKNVQLEEGTEATAYEPYYVTSDVTVTQAKNHTLKAIWERKPNVSNQNLSDYQEVEYIESSGTQYIDTGLVPNQDTSVELVVNVLQSASQDFFGTSSINDGYSYGFYDGVSRVYDNYNDDIALYNDHILGMITVKKEKSITTVTGDYSFTGYHNSSTFTAAHSLYLFSRWKSSGVYRPASMQCFSFKIWDNGTLVRNMIPAYRKSDEEVGLYDTVNDVFYQNAGTGDFIAGPDVTNS